MVSADELIKGFLIFEKRTGRPFIHRTYPGFNADPFLLIGFLNAMIKFAREAMVGRTNIRLIDMHDLRFAFMESKGIVFTAICSSLCSPLDLEFKIKTIISLFLEAYSEKEWTDPSLSIDHYSPFNKIVDEILKGEVKYVEATKVKHLQELLKDFKTKKEEIIGIAIISFTGIIIVNYLQSEHYELISSLINSLFSIHISGIKTLYLHLVDKYILIKAVSIDCYLVYIFNTKMKSAVYEIVNNEDYRNFENKIVEILK